MNSDSTLTAKVSTKWFKEKEINVLAQSLPNPDLNPIEGWWVDLKRQTWPIKPDSVTPVLWRKRSELQRKLLKFKGEFYQILILILIQKKCM